MRVLVVNSHGIDTGVGGAEAYVKQLLHELPNLGHDVSLLRSFPGPDPDGVPVRTLYSSDWRENDLLRLRNHVRDATAPASSRLRREVERVGPALVHTNNLPGISTGIWGVCSSLGIPVVHTMQDYQLLCPRVTLLQRDGTPCRPSPLLCGLRNRSLARHAQAVRYVIGPSEHILSRHEVLFGSTPSSLVRYPFSAPPEREFARPTGPFRTIGYMGALDYHKGIRELLAAAPALGEKGIRIKIAGRGSLEADIERAAAELETVEYAGFVSGAGKEEFIRSCEAGILPSVWEEPGGPPFAVLDWLTAGRPVLVSPRGGLGEAISVCAGAFPVEPTKEGIESAVWSLAHPDVWRDAVEAVRPVQSGQSEKRWLDEHQRIYESALRPR